MHEYSKRIGEHIKAHYSDLGSMNREELEELKAWACVMKELTEADINIRGIKAMDEAEQEEKMFGRMGYRGRNPRTGRFVHRSGRGRSAGYTPYMYMLEDEDGYGDMYEPFPEMMGSYRMGYTGPGRNNGSNSSDYSSGNDANAQMRQSSRYGEAYDRYKDNRRHYTENPTPEHQRMMKESAEDVFEDIEELAKKVYSEADASDKAKFKQKLTLLAQKMQ